MDPMIILFVFGTFMFSLVSLVLQAFTMRSVRSAPRDQRLDSPTRGETSPPEASGTDSVAQGGPPSASGSSELKPKSSEISTDEEGNPVPIADESRLPVADPQWQWLAYKEIRKKYGEKSWIECGKKVDATHDDPFMIYYYAMEESGSFEIVNNVKIDVSNAAAYFDGVRVAVRSTSLIGILRRYLPRHGDLEAVTKPRVAGRDLYHVLGSLKQHTLRTCAQFPREKFNVDVAPKQSRPAYGENDDADLRETRKNLGDTPAAVDSAEGILHLKHLVRFLEEEYNYVLKTQARMRREKCVSWVMLWTFLPKGLKVGYRCQDSEELLCAVVIGIHYERQPTGMNQRFKGLLLVELETYDYDGTRYRSCQLHRTIEEFHQEKKFSQLPVCPVEILGEPVDLEKKFRRDGERFRDLAVRKSNRFMCYAGSMYERMQPTDKIEMMRAQMNNNGDWNVRKFKADGRVMIDQSSFAAMNPNYPMQNARPPSKSSHGLIGARDTRKSEEGFSEESLIFAPGIVYGFSFALKKWGSFAVSRFSDVTFDEEAFEDLVMESDLKDLLHNLVRQYISPDRDPAESPEQVDPVAGKGQGCIVLCHGPPGTGKTLTAESIAESMKCPLWALSVAELGTDPEKLEKTLMKVLDIAALWKAVLLLDEADVYLEQRTPAGLVTQNAMTGVFLRQLEYYRGILFLTTNRVRTIDDAFKSRISVLLRYHDLKPTEKARIWGNLLKRAHVDGIGEEFCTEMASRPLNGRQIRNAIRTAQMWAKSKNQRFAVKHLKFVMKILPNDFSAFDEIVVSKRPELGSTLNGPFLISSNCNQR